MSKRSKSQEKEVYENVKEEPVSEEEDDEEEEYYDLTDNPNYQVLSSIFETDEGETIADLLNKIEKNTRSIAMSQATVAQAQVKVAQATIKQTAVIEKFITLFLESQSNDDESDE